MPNSIHHGSKDINSRVFRKSKRRPRTQHSGDGVGKAGLGGGNMPHWNGPAMRAHFGNIFRERIAEWLCAYVLFGWGVVLLSPANTFGNPSYAALARIAPEEVWGITCLIGGLSRLIVLAINGLWLPSYRFRCFLAFLSIFFWLQILLGIAWSNPAPTGLASYSGFMLADMYAVFRSAVDYRMAMAIRRVQNGPGSSGT